MALRERPALYSDQTRLMLVEPPAGFRCHLESRGLIEQSPAVPKVDEQPLAVRAEQAEIATARGQKAVGADMALGQQGMKHAGHPDGRGQRRLVGDQAAAGAQNLAMWPQRFEFLGLERHMAAIAAEKGDEATVFVLRLPQVLAEQIDDLCFAQLQSVEQRRGAKEARRNGSAAPLRAAMPSGSRFRQGQSLIDESQVCERRRRRMILLKPAEEPALDAFARREPKGRVLDGDNGMLMLETFPGQTARQGLGESACPRRKTVDLQGVGGETDPLRQRANHAPGVVLAYALILARSDDYAPLRVRQRRVIDVLTDVIFIGPHRAVVGQSQILDINEIKGFGAVAVIFQRQAPEPRGG